MKLIIDIPEEDYKGICHLKNEQLRMLPEEVAETLIRIANGTPLPKGHGDIVDIETLIDMFWDGNSMEITKYDLSVVEPIIEADKESE